MYICVSVCLVRSSVSLSIDGRNLMLLYLFMEEIFPEPLQFQMQVQIQKLSEL